MKEPCESRSAVATCGELRIFDCAMIQGRGLRRGESRGSASGNCNIAGNDPPAFPEMCFVMSYVKPDPASANVHLSSMAAVIIYLKSHKILGPVKGGYVSLCIGTGLRPVHPIAFPPTKALCSCRQSR